MIGIYGGTFDPVHYGHLRPAIDVYSELSLSEVRLIPAGVPAHRNVPLANSEQRYQMLLLATENIDALTVDDRELKRAGSSYMIDTIRSLQADYANDRFCLILGMDAFIGLEAWREWKMITQLVNIVITCRPNFDLDSIPESELKSYIRNAAIQDKDKFLASLTAHCYFCPVTQLDISASKIRDLIKQGGELNFLLPDVVINYLLQNQIYQ